MSAATQLTKQDQDSADYQNSRGSKAASGRINRLTKLTSSI
jgi:hypothetical protein